MTSYSICAALLAAMTTILTAQNESKDQGEPKVLGQQPDSAPQYVGIEECIGATVAMKPSAAEVANARAEQKEARGPKGTIDEVLIDAKTGKAEWGIISFGGLLGIGDKTIALPWDVLRWSSADNRYDADVNSDQIGKMTPLDLNKARKQGLDDALMAHLVEWHAVVVPATKPEAPVDVVDEAAKKAVGKEVSAAEERHADHKEVLVPGTTMLADRARLLCASDLGKRPLFARGEEFGKVSASIMDRESGTIALAVVSHGGVLGVGAELYLLPFTMLKQAKKGDSSAIVVDKSADDLAKSCKYVKPERGVVSLPDAKRCLQAVRESASRTPR